MEERVEIGKVDLDGHADTVTRDNTELPQEKRHRFKPHRQVRVLTGFGIPAGTQTYDNYGVGYQTDKNGTIHRTDSIKMTKKQRNRLMKFKGKIDE